jgi:hypothetical protein
MPVEAATLPPGEAPTQSLPDLTLTNFFSEGWNDPFQREPRYTPDMALLRVLTNHLAKRFRVDYVGTDVANNPKLDGTELGNVIMAYAFNRRLMFEATVTYQWNVPPSGASANGAAGAFLARFQLVETTTQSYAFQTKVTAPNKSLGQTQTSIAYSLAGWQDMHALLPALGRFGLYGSFQYESLVGPRKAGAATNDVSYDISIAETWTPESTPVVRNFTTFLEAYATTLLDGATAGKTTVSLTPGVRFWFLPQNSLTLGVDVPVSHAATYHTVVRATYILNF